MTSSATAPEGAEPEYTIKVEAVAPTAEVIQLRILALIAATQLSAGGGGQDVSELTEAVLGWASAPDVRAVPADDKGFARRVVLAVKEAAARGLLPEFRAPAELRPGKGR